MIPHDFSQRHLKEPYIFVIDWDGTIAGNVTYQSQYYSVVSTLKTHGFKALTHVVPHAFSPKANLIRPGFASWMAGIKQAYPDAMFFIYTASEKRWALNEIAWVEKLHGIKFARPIFTRDDCVVDSGGNMRKSLARVFPRMMKTVSKTVGVNLTPTQRQNILEKYTIIIDNNAVYTDHTDKLLLCPEYGYTVFENLLQIIPKDARAHPAIQNMIYGLINSGYLCVMASDKDDPMHTLSKQYTWLASKCKSICSANEAYKNDDFWIHLRKLIVNNKLRVFSPSIIRQLQDASWKHAKTMRTQAHHTH